MSFCLLSTAELITAASPSATPAMTAVMITHSTADAPRLGAVRAYRTRVLRNAREEINQE